MTLWAHKLKIIYKFILRKIKRVLFFPIKNLYSNSFGLLLNRIGDFPSDKYFLNLRSELHTCLPSMVNSNSSSSLNVFHGLYTTIQPHFLKEGLYSLGVKSRIETLDHNPIFLTPDQVRSDIHHPDLYHEWINFDNQLLDLEKSNLLPRVTRVDADFNNSSTFNYFIKNWSKFDVFHFNWFLSFLPDNADVEFINKSGRSVYFHFRGCFILSKIAPIFTGRGLSVVDACAHCNKMGWRKQYFSRFHRATKFANRIFVSTPNLCHCSPDFEYFPLSLDPNLAKIPPPLSERYKNREKVIILHAPSGGQIKRNEKGTEIIISIINQLKYEGFNIELKFIENLSRAEAIELYGMGDIFIEQLNLGSYGNTAIEAMAYGIPVLSSNHPSHNHLNPNCPVVHVDPGNLLRELQKLILFKEKREEIGRKCYDFVRIFHGNATVSKHLLSIYQEDLGQLKHRPPNTLSNLNPSYSSNDIVINNKN